MEIALHRGVMVQGHGEKSGGRWRGRVPVQEEMKGGARLRYYDGITLHQVDYKVCLVTSGPSEEIRQRLSLAGGSRAWVVVIPNPH